MTNNISAKAYLKVNHWKPLHKFEHEIWLKTNPHPAPWVRFDTAFNTSVKYDEGMLTRQTGSELMRYKLKQYVASDYAFSTMQVHRDGRLMGSLGHFWRAKGHMSAKALNLLGRSSLLWICPNSITWLSPNCLLIARWATYYGSASSLLCLNRIIWYKWAKLGSFRRSKTWTWLGLSAPLVPQSSL